MGNKKIEHYEKAEKRESLYFIVGEKMGVDF